MFRAFAAYFIGCSTDPIIYVLAHHSSYLMVFAPAMSLLFRLTYLLYILYFVKRVTLRMPYM